MAIDLDSDDEDVKMSLGDGVTKRRKPSAVAFKTCTPLYCKSQVGNTRSFDHGQG